MAGEQTVRFSESMSGGGVSVGGATGDSVACDLILPFKKVIPADSTDVEIDMAFPIATVKVIGIEANKNCTLKTNSADIPGDTLTLRATRPVKWRTGDVASLFLTVDVTKFFITTGTDDTTLTILVGLDSTPGID